MLITKDFYIKDLSCIDCGNKLLEYLKTKFPDCNITLNFTLSVITIIYNNSLTDENEFIKAIKKFGYTTAKESSGVFTLKEKKFVMLLISITFLLVGLLFEFVINNIEVIKIGKFTINLHEIIFGISAISSGIYTMKKAFTTLINKKIVIETLITIAALGAILIDAVGEAAAVFSLFLLAEMLESFSIEKSRKGLEKLLNQTTDSVFVKRGEIIENISAENLKIGDTLVVKPGEKIGADGVVTLGESHVNQSSITGESIPAKKTRGSKVYSSTINIDGYIEIYNEKSYKDTKIANILKLVKESEKNRSQTERFIDSFAKIYTPIVISIAVMVTIVPVFVFSGDFSVWFYKSLLLLLVSCPCALALSTPVSMTSAITAAATNGVLFKGGDFIEKSAKIKNFCFDKTGTLTKPGIEVVNISVVGSLSKTEVTSIAAAIENKSHHHIGKAIVEYAKIISVKIEKATDFKDISGLGIEGVVNEKKYKIGNRKFFSENQNRLINKLLDNSKTNNSSYAILGDEKDILAIFFLKNPLREESAAVIKNLKKIGVEKCFMLTGDNKESAQHIAKQLNISYKSDLMPQDKQDFVNKIKTTGTTAMVGDGINDTPSFIASDISFSMGLSGTDASKEVSDVTITNDDLSKIVYAIKLGKSTMKIIKENIILSIAVKLTFTILVFPGYVTLWMAVAIGDMGVTLAVIANSLRLTSKKP